MWADALPVAAMFLSNLCRLLNQHSHKVASLHSQPLPHNSLVLKSGPLRNAGLTETRNVLMWADALPVAAMLLYNLCRLVHHHSHKVASLHSQQWLSDSLVLKSGHPFRNAGLTEKGNVFMWADALPVAAMLLSHLCRQVDDHSHEAATLHSQQWLSDSLVLKSGHPFRNAGLTEKGNVFMWADALPVAAMLLSHLCRQVDDHSHEAATLHSQQWLSDSHVLKSGPPSEMQA